MLTPVVTVCGPKDAIMSLREKRQCANVLKKKQQFEPIFSGMKLKKQGKMFRRTAFYLRI